MAPRVRMLHPDFFLDEILGKLPSDNQILFAGLWGLADREGRLEDRPLKIKAQLFPYRNHDTEACLQTLTDSGFLIRYSVDDRNFIQIKNFLKYQKPHVREEASRIPEANLGKPRSTLGEPRSALGAPRLPVSVSVSVSDPVSVSVEDPQNELPFVADAPLPQKSKPRRLKAKAPEPPPNPRHTPLVKAISEAFSEERQGLKYAFHGRDFPALASLLAIESSDEEILRRWRIGLNHPDKFYVCHSIFALHEKWNAYSHQPAARARGDPRKGSFRAEDADKELLSQVGEYSFVTGGMVR